MNDFELDTTEWDQLWIFGRENALRSGVAANESLENFWRAAFSAKHGATRLLDIACGNGALARYLDQLGDSENKSIEYIGVDSARINPPEAKTFQALVPKFLANKNIEDVSFQPGQFDLVVSQFGFEYCRKDRVIELVSDWLRPGGHVIFVVHSETSAITLESKQILEQLRILEESALIPLLFRLLVRLEAIAHSQDQKDAEAEHLRQRINSTCSNLEEIAGYLHESQFLIATMGLLLSLLASERAHIPAVVRKENLVKLSTSLQYQQTRLRQQFDCALGVEEMTRIKALWSDGGFSDVTSEALTCEGEELGEVIRASKAS